MLTGSPGDAKRPAHQPFDDRFGRSQIGGAHGRMRSRAGLTGPEHEPLAATFLLAQGRTLEDFRRSRQLVAADRHRSSTARIGAIADGRLGRSPAPDELHSVSRRECSMT
jgi:hypothetical protein